MTHRQNRAPLLLIELMMIFAAAEKLSTRARNRFQAATMLQTAADAYIAADGDPEQTAALLDKVWNSPEAASSARSSSQSDHTAPETPSSAQTTHDDSAARKPLPLPGVLHSLTIPHRRHLHPHRPPTMTLLVTRPPSRHPRPRRAPTVTPPGTRSPEKH